MSTHAPLPPLPSVPGTSPSTAVLDAFRIAIAHQLVSTLPESGLTLEKAYQGVDFGRKGIDFTVALPRFRLGGKPDELAKKVAANFKPDAYIQAITPDKAFLHYTLNTATLVSSVLTQIHTLPKATYGQLKPEGPKKKVIIEYSSPNIAKAFHVGHLRSTIIGGFLANLYKEAGCEVVSMNYLGDWGTQFGLILHGFHGWYPDEAPIKSELAGHDLPAEKVVAAAASIPSTTVDDIASLSITSPPPAKPTKKYGSEEELLKNPIKHLLDVYVRVNKDAETDPEVKVDAAKWFRAMERAHDEGHGGEASALALKDWTRWRELSVETYKAEYSRLNVEFDDYSGESTVARDKMEKSIRALAEKGYIEDKDGKLINKDYHFVDKDGNYIDATGQATSTPVVATGALLVKLLAKYKIDDTILRKTDGSSVYLTRDIGAVIERYEKYKFDKMIYVVSSQQDLHLRQLFKIISLLGYEWADRLEHVNYGLVLGMSTRRGTVVFLDQIIMEASGVMHDQMKKNEAKYNAVENPEMVSQEVGITGVKIQDFAAKRINNYTFNWDRMLSFEGDTGPYLQYAHVRLASIERKNPHLMPLPPATEVDTSSLSESPQAREIVFLLSSYPDIIKTALKTSEPSGVVTFAFRLSHAISSAWEILIVKGEEDVQKARARMLLYLGARDVLGQAMRLLTIKPLERM